MVSDLCEELIHASQFILVRHHDTIEVIHLNLLHNPLVVHLDVCFDVQEVGQPLLGLLLP